MVLRSNKAIRIGKINSKFKKWVQWGSESKFFAIKLSFVMSLPWDCHGLERSIRIWNLKSLFGVRWSWTFWKWVVLWQSYGNLILKWKSVFAFTMQYNHAMHSPASLSRLVNHLTQLNPPFFWEQHCCLTYINCMCTQSCMIANLNNTNFDDQNVWYSDFCDQGYIHQVPTVFFW